MPGGWLWRRKTAENRVFLKVARPTGRGQGATPPDNVTSFGRRGGSQRGPPYVPWTTEEAPTVRRIRTLTRRGPNDGQAAPPDPHPAHRRDAAHPARPARARRRGRQLRPGREARPRRAARGSRDG